MSGGLPVGDGLAPLVSSPSIRSSSILTAPGHLGPWEIGLCSATGGCSRSLVACIWWGCLGALTLLVSVSPWPVVSVVGGHLALLVPGGLVLSSADFPVLSASLGVSSWFGPLLVSPASSSVVWGLQSHTYTSMNICFTCAYMHMHLCPCMVVFWFTPVCCLSAFGVVFIDLLNSIVVYILQCIHFFRIGFVEEKQQLKESVDFSGCGGFQQIPIQKNISAMLAMKPNCN